MAIEIRPDRAVLKISGPDSQTFLHDLLTAKVDREDAGARWWALLSPQGKVQADGLIGFADGAFWLDVSSELFASFLKRLRLYKLRANLEIEDLSDSHAVGFTLSPVDGLCHKDLRGERMGYRVIASRAASTHWDGREAAYMTARLALGILECGTDFGPDSSFPHDLGMDLLGGVDFSKGCYVGQEVVSRMQHRGTARRRPALAEGEGLAKGAQIFVAGKPAGEVLLVPEARGVGRGVSIVRIDRVPADGHVEIGGLPARLVLPSWASYAFSDSGGN